MIQQLGQLKSIGLALEISRSHTIEYRVSQIVPQGHCDFNKGPSVLLGSAARRRISISMWDQTTARNMLGHIRHR